MNIIGKCVQQVGKAYSLCRGIDRQLQVDKVLDTDKLFPPSEVAKWSLFEVDAERLTAKNYDGITVTRDHMYEINWEAKEKSRKTFGLVKWNFVNVIVVGSNICGMDIASWKEVEGDKPSTD